MNEKGPTGDHIMTAAMLVFVGLVMNGCLSRPPYQPAAWDWHDTKTIADAIREAARIAANGEWRLDNRTLPGPPQ